MRVEGLWVDGCRISGDPSIQKRTRKVSTASDLAATHLHHIYRGREFFIENLLVRIHFIIVMIGWTGLAPPFSR